MSLIRRRGFTLVEILVVITILAILASLLFVAIHTAGVGAKRAKVLTFIGSLHTAMNGYNLANGTFPPPDPGNSLMFDSSETTPGVLNYLETSLKFSFDHKMIGSDKKIRDPWGNPYIFTKTDPGGLDDFTFSDFIIYSTGEDPADKSKWLYKKDGK